MSKTGKVYRAKQVRAAAVPPEPGTYRVMEYAVLRGGLVDASTALTMIAAWLTCRERLHRWPASVDEYCDWWKQARSLGFRELRAFRRCFPMYASPTELCEACKLRLPFRDRFADDTAVAVAHVLKQKMVVAA